MTTGILDRPAQRRRPSRRETLAAIGLTLIAGLGLAGPDAVIARSAAQAPERIVAAGGAITEILYAFGLQDRLVGVDSTSQFPAEALKEKANIGYVRALSAEGVLSLRPALVLAINGAGPPDAVALIRESGARLAMIPDEPSAAGIVAKIEAVGAAVGAREPAHRLAAQTQARFDELSGLRAALQGKKRVLFVLSLQNGRVMVGGRNSSAAAMIALAGGINAAEAIEGYKPMTDEAIIAAAPDAVLMMRNGGSHDTTADELFSLPAFSQTPAAAGRSHLVMDGLYLLGFGPRTPAAARDLMALLHPEATIPPLKTAASQ